MSSTAKLTTVCNHCSRAIRFNASLLGRSAKCPGCSTLITLADSKTRDINLSEASETQLKTQSPTNETLSQHSKPVAASSVANPTNSTATSRFQSERYELRRCLGKGGFGEVWEALDRHIGRAVAIKLPLFLPKEKKKIERFMREGRAAAQLRHPNIVSVFDAGEINGQHYLAIEFVSGSPLSELGSNRSFTQQQAARMIADLARALHYAHSQKIIHRDIKPHNIVLNDKGRPQILDFGLAKSLADEAALTIDGTVMGTPAYMSPEQARGDLKNVGPASDQYSLGATLYWLLTGQALFSGPPAAVIAQVVSVEPQPPQKFATNLDDRLAAICQKSISKLPSDRYESCLELARDLESYLNDEVVLARPISALGRFYRWANKNRLDATLIAIACSVLAIAVLTSTFGYLRSSKLLAEATVLEGSVKKALNEIETTKSELQTQAEALNQAKLRSIEAKQQLEDAQRTAEATQEELKSVIAENETLQMESKKQLAIVASNESKSDQLRKLAQKAKTETDRVVNRPLESMSSNDRITVKDRIYSDVFSAIERKDYQAADKLLNQIPPHLRDTRWKLQSQVIKKLGLIRVVRKSLKDLFLNVELNGTDINLEHIDSTSSTLHVRISKHQNNRRTHTFVILDLAGLDRVLATSSWTTDPWDDGRQIPPREHSKRPSFAIANRTPSRLQLFLNDISYVDGRSSSEKFELSHCKIQEVTNLGGRQYGSLDARALTATLNPQGEVVVVVQRKFQSNQWSASSQLVGNKQIDGSLQIIVFSPTPTTSWNLSDEALFTSLLLPEYQNVSLSQIEYFAGTKFFRSSNQLSDLPFEYYDSRLRQNIFGVYSIRDMKLVRIAAVNRKDEKERQFSTQRIVPEPKLWSDFTAERVLQLTDAELSDVELPPRRGCVYSLSLGERWGEFVVSDDVIKLGQTPICRLPGKPGSIKNTDIVWSTSGDSLAFITEQELWMVDFLDENSSPST